MKKSVCVGLAALAAVGCEHGITLTGTITIVPDVQRAFSRARPGVVIVSGEIPKSSGFSYRVAVLCDPEPLALVVPFQHDSFGCAKEGVVRARAIAATDAEGLVCGPNQEGWAGLTADVAAGAGEQVVFASRGGRFGCASGVDSIQIVVAPPR